MFGLFKRKVRHICAPVDGRVVDITEVPDEVFAQKLAGDGVAIEPAGELICAPVSGKVVKLFETGHAFIIRSDKALEVLVHIGIDTVALQGKGFETLVEEGAEVEVGTPIVRVDLAYLKQEGKSVMTPVLIGEESEYKEIVKRLRIVKQGDEIMEVK